MVKDYEGKQFPVQLPDAIEAVLFRMDQMGLSQRDLVPFIVVGAASAASLSV